MAATTQSDPVPQSETDGYALERHHRASVRLNLQHCLSYKDLGYNVHPSVKIEDNARIADIACGSGFWLMEVAEQFPSAQLDGLDISLEQTPPLAWLPSNIKLIEWNMNDVSGPPAELEGKYDFVHIRHVVMAVNDDVAPLIGNVLRLLKPGGYLQWDEHDFSDLVMYHRDTVDPAEVAQKSPSTSKLKYLMAGKAGKDWVRNLPDVLVEHGFEKGELHRHQPALKHVKFETDMLIMAWEEVISMLPGETEQKQMFRMLVSGMRVEASQGGAMATQKLVTVARKPTS